MKRNLRFLAGAFLLTATALFTGCNSDDDFLMNPQTDSVTPETRANFNDDGTTTITFDDFDETFMAVSPKAENYYTLYGYTAEEPNQGNIRSRFCVCLRHEYCNQFLWSVY